MVNRVELIGNLTRDPELHCSPNGVAYCYLRVATNRFANGVEHTDYHFVTAWRDLAERCAQFLGTSDRVYIDGRLETNAYTTSQGQRVERIRVVATRVQFLDGRRRNGGRIDGEESTESRGNEATHIANVIAGGDDTPPIEREPAEEPA